MMKQMIRVDARGDQCPVPVIKTKKALQELGGAGSVEVHVDNEIAVQNLEKMASVKQLSCHSEKLAERDYRVVITAGEPEAPAKEAEQGRTAEVCGPDRQNRTVVAISSALMGTGNEELGKVLLKGFLYALAQSETLPSAVLFYNGGVQLTTAGSESLEDLKELEGQGVEILSCGTCLSYYELTGRLMVGEVTNMYTILEKLQEADKIIKP